MSFDSWKFREDFWIFREVSGGGLQDMILVYSEPCKRVILVYHLKSEWLIGANVWKIQMDY